MTQLDSQTRALQDLWDNDFPLSKAMGVEVVSFSEHVLTTRTALAPNTNVHGTAFAGSLYALEALTAWGVLYLELAAHDLDASIIHASGQINFAKPVREDIVALSSFAGHQDAIHTLKETGKVKLTLTTQVLVDNNVASEFSGVYVARLNP